MMVALKLCFIFIVVPLTDGAIPGTFFWKPRLGIDLSVPTTGEPVLVSSKDVVNGFVVLVDGYEAGMTVLALAVGIVETYPLPHMNPSRGYFYTNAYRWALRHLSKLPYWLAGKRDKYVQTQRVWNKRFYYTESMIPKWMRILIPFVDEEDWRNEIQELRRFKKYSEFSFAKQYRYPSKTFNNFKSFEIKDKGISESSSSFHSSQSKKG